MLNIKFNLIVISVTMVLILGACSDTEDTAVEVSESESTQVEKVSLDSDSSSNPKGYQNPERIVSLEWLNEHRNDDNLVIVDVRKLKDGVAESYNAGHIPGAINIPANTTFQIETDGVRGILPTAGHIENVLSQSGVKPSDTIIFYDDIKSLWASRALWGMEVYGHTNTKLLDGDIKLWESNGYEISQDSVQLSASDYTFSAAPNNNLVIGWEAVKASIEDNSDVVCDTRSPGEYTGKDVRAERGGHIPGSINVEWVNNASEDGTFLDADSLKKLYNTANITPDKKVYTLCQTAVRATHTWFVLSELLGYENVAVYDGSWIEWGNKSTDETPIDLKA